MRQPTFVMRLVLHLIFIATAIAAVPLPFFGQQVSAQTDLPAAVQPVFLDPDSDSNRGSVIVPVDSWIYPAFERLFSLGYADSAYLGMRPWTRTSCLQILQETYPKLQNAPEYTEAWSIFQ